MLADATRFFFQEIIVPRDADSIAFLIAPAASLVLPLLPIVFVPAAPSFVAISVEYSLPLVLAISALTPIVIIVMAWAANNKFTIIGGIREAFMVIAYELSLFISALAMAIFYGTLNLEDIVSMQKSLPGVILNPLAAITFFVAMVMATSRLPFDIVEGEQEIVAGPFTEYTGILYGLVMGAGYVQLYILCLVFVELFLSGWYPYIGLLGEIYPALGGVSLFIKAYLLMVFIVFLRSVYGRYRLDQAISIGWKSLLPLSLASVFLSLGLLAAGVVI